MDQRVRGEGFRQGFSGPARMHSGGGAARRAPGRGSGGSPHIVVMALRILVLYSILTSAVWVLLTSP
jgi:hypothetical protein